jgi:hypothetical protein
MASGKTLREFSSPGFKEKNRVTLRVHDRPIYAPYRGIVGRRIKGDKYLLLSCPKGMAQK